MQKHEWWGKNQEPRKDKCMLQLVQCGNSATVPLLLRPVFSGLCFGDNSVTGCGLQFGDNSVMGFGSSL